MTYADSWHDVVSVARSMASTSWCIAGIGITVSLADLTICSLCNWASLLLLLSMSLLPVYGIYGHIVNGRKFKSGKYISILPPLMHIH